MKQCSKCKKMKLAEKEFSKNRTTFDGFSAHCRICKAKVAGIYRKLHLEQIRESQKKWRQANLEQSRERQKKWRQANIEKARQHAKKYRDSHKIEISAGIMKWKKQNPEYYRDEYKRNRDRYIARYRDCIDNLRAVYIKALLVGGTNLSFRDVPGSLVEAKRVHLKLIRSIRHAKLQRAS